MANSRRFVLCADDYAMTPAVSSGILALLEAGRISAAGAMTSRPAWQGAARDFSAHAATADLGLHFNLTCGAPLTRMANLAPGGEMPKLGAILKAAASGHLPQAEIEAELDAQLSAFEDAMGRAPDFIDGHQHVHAMPGVRHVLARVLPARYPGTKPWLRVSADSPLRVVARGVEVRKALLVSALTAPFGARMRALGFATNQGFSGYSGFNPAADYGADCARYLAAPGARHLIMCHPGAVDDELVALDPVTHSRPIERDFLLSQRFVEICAKADMTLCRFSELT
jgi:predicted glycoside hydrolase/deacetylase ChbG (UPF0249 family)